MNEDRSEGPAKRSCLKPQLLLKSKNELNVLSVKSSDTKILNRDVLRNFHKPSPQSKKTTSSPRLYQIESLKPHSPSQKKVPVSEVSSSRSRLNFKIHQDDAHDEIPPLSRPQAENVKNSKVSISSLSTKSILFEKDTQRQIQSQQIEKVPISSILDTVTTDELEFKKSVRKLSSPQSLNLINLTTVEKHSLMYQSQLPLVNLNNWYKISQHQIIDKSQHSAEEQSMTRKPPTDVVISHEFFSDHLIYAKCKSLDNGAERMVFLLNHRQHVHDVRLINDLQNEAKLCLYEGFTTPALDGIKIFKNWKLLL